MKTSLHSLCSAFLLLALSSSAKVAPPPPISLSNFHLTADLSDTTATFTLTATAHVQSPKGGSLELLSGKVALTQLTPNPKYHLRANQNRFFLDFDRSGTFPIQMKFNAAIADHDNWKTVNFHIFPTALQPITLQGLPPETQFNFIGAARPERKGTA